MIRRRTQPGPIGLDLDAGVIRAAQVAREGDGFRVVAQSRMERADPDAPIDAQEMTRVAQALHRQGFSGRRVTMAAPQRLVRRMMLDLPPAGASVDASMFAREEFASAQEWAPGSFELASWELPAPEAGAPRRQALAGGLLHSDADDSVRLLEEAGLSVVAIDLRCWALGRALDVGEALPGVLVGLDFSWECATLLAAHRGEIVYERAFQGAGMAALRDAAGDRLGVDPPLALHALRSNGQDRRATPVAGMAAPLVDAGLESMSADLRTAAAFLDHRYAFPSPVTLIVTGDAPARPEHIAGRLELDLGSAPFEEDGLDREMACALGLALWEEA